MVTSNSQDTEGEEDATTAMLPSCLAVATSGDPRIRKQDDSILYT